MDIYDVNNDLVTTLCRNKQIGPCSKKFLALATNHEKVNFIEGLLVTYQQIPRLEVRFGLRTKKNDEKSLHFRKEGNRFFSLQNKDYFKAMTLYNESICFAEEDSPNMAIGYANRSAILFEWKLYRECLENIELARKANFPENLKRKLDEREKKCLELVSTQKKATAPHEFQLISEPYQSIPGVADCLAMRSTKQEGRFLYTKKDLNPGDLVAIDDPFCTLLLPSMRYIRCTNCIRENCLTLIPCRNCTTAMFCSKKCLEEANESFHKYECPIIDMLSALFNKVQLIALRITLVALSLFDSVAEFQEFCERSENQNKSPFDIDYRISCKREHYRAIHGLVTHQEHRSSSDLFQRGVFAAVIKRFITRRTSLKDVLKDETEINFFIDILFRHLQTAPCNTHSICLIEQKDEGDDDTKCASGAYPLTSLLNHSCAPNTVRFFKGTTLYLIALQPIPANGILYDNYGYHFLTEPRDLRQNSLETQYYFKCKCAACEKNFPLYLDLKIHPKVPNCVSKGDVSKLEVFDRKFAEKNLKKFIKFLIDYKNYYPCIQIIRAEESMKMAINILLTDIPLKAKVAAM